MKWTAACCVILLICLLFPAGRVMSATGTTAVVGYVALVAYEVSLTRIGYFTAAISWKTNSGATSQVFYDTISHNTVAEYAFFTNERQALLDKHMVALNKLSPSTVYYYRVRSATEGAEFVSDEYTFTTLTSPGGWKGWLVNLLVEFTSALYFWRP
jgi:hypothetical protein